MTGTDIPALIRRQGYALVEHAIPAAFADRLRQAVLDLQSEDEAKHGRAYLYEIGQEGFVVNVGDRGAAFEALLNEFPMAGVVEELLDGDAVLYLYQGVIVPPGGGIGAYPWKWHCDLYHVTRMLRGEPFIPGVNALFYVDDVNPENGATWLAPATQGLDQSELPWNHDESLQSVSQIQLSARKGTALLFNPLLWHCAGANRTARARCAVKMLCVRGWMLPQMDYARSIGPAVRERLAEKAQRMIGRRSMIARSFAEEAAWSGAADADLSYRMEAQR